LYFSNSWRIHSVSDARNFAVLLFADSRRTLDVRLEVRAGVIPAVVGAVEAVQEYSSSSVPGVVPSAIVESDLNAAPERSAGSLLGGRSASINGFDTDR
jgi:hypothetical protein